MTRELNSERFLLRPIDAADGVALHELWTNESVRRFLWDGKVIPLEQTEEIVEKNRRLFRESGFGIWGIHEHNSKQLVGFTGYWYFRTPPSLELLFGVSSDHWNRGIASEASKCVIRYGFEGLGFQTIEASTDVANTASQRVLEKLTMPLQRRAVVDGLDTMFYKLQRDDWWKILNRSNSPLQVSDDVVRGEEIRSLCPCHAGWEVFEQHVQDVLRSLKDRSRVVRAHALHVFEDAARMQSAEELSYYLEPGEERIGEKRASSRFRSMAERLEARRNRKITRRKRGQ